MFFQKKHNLFFQKIQKIISKNNFKKQIQKKSIYTYFSKNVLFKKKIQKKNSKKTFKKKHSKKRSVTRMKRSHICIAEIAYS